jgi:hypothetical protein
MKQLTVHASTEAVSESTVGWYVQGISRVLGGEASLHAAQIRRTT